MSEPSAIMKWLRVNLAFMAFLLALVSSVSGMVVGGTWRVAKYDSRFESLEGKIDGLIASEKETARTTEKQRDEDRKRLDSDLDHISDKLNALDKRIDAVQQAQGSVDSNRIGLVELKIQTLGDAIKDNLGAISQLSVRRHP